ncbi:MAG: Fe-S protein assembly co-chaperone HscB [Pedobacter sp.]|nr:Fe-S protein assembly co-chaperone HscB [Pedobacter sp.]
MSTTPDYFQLFDLTPAFELDAEALLPRYRELQKQFHPDRFADQPADVQRVAVQKAADINTAFSTLQDPVLRARHLLALADRPLNIESATVSDADFLMAQMELREQLEEADDFELLTELREEAEDWLASLGREFAIDYREQEWAEAADSVRKMQFMSRFIDEVSDKEARLEDAEYENDDFEDDE